MTDGWQNEIRPGAALHTLVREATTALIAMDTERLEELARCCADLNRELQSTGRIGDRALDLRQTQTEVDLLGRILVETRANLVVLSRLHAIRLREHLAAQTSSSNPSLLSSGVTRHSLGDSYGDN